MVILIFMAYVLLRVWHLIIQDSSTVYYRDLEGLGFLTPKYHPKISLISTL